jgi:hypothetical protein
VDIKKVDIVEIKIRALTRKDTVTVAMLIKKMIDKAGRGYLLNLIASSEKPVNSDNSNEKEENSNDKLIEIGMDIILSLFDFVLEDVSAWFADLVNMSLEEYNEKAPFDADLRIVEQLLEAPDIKNFFTLALRESKMIRGFASQFSEKKD